MGRSWLPGIWRRRHNAESAGGLAAARSPPAFSASTTSPDLNSGGRSRRRGGGQGVTPRSPETGGGFGRPVRQVRTPGSRPSGNRRARAAALPLRTGRRTDAGPARPLLHTARWPEIVFRARDHVCRDISDISPGVELRGRASHKAPPAVAIGGSSPWGGWGVKS